MMKSIFKKLMALGCMTAAVFGFSSCDDELDIQQSYPFTVEIMPVPNKVTKGETVEIRCEMIKEGEFAEALYTIRYFQFEGKGTLKMDNGIIFLPNDRYLLENDKFRLYYTSECEEAQNFIVVIEDNFGNVFELEFDFNDDTQTKQEESEQVAEGGETANG
ncbi:MAG: DUF3872 domain-containing protein [Acutalibacteraceae bacterium]|nr:DUF3872 domain-containing protein [Acutalibacteraceae bacterium]